MDTRFLDAFTDSNAWIDYLKHYGFQCLGVFVYFLTFCCILSWKIKIKEHTRDSLLALKVLTPVCFVLFYIPGYLSLCFESIMLPLGTFSFLLLHITAIVYNLSFQSPSFFIEETDDFVFRKVGYFRYLTIFVVWLTVEVVTLLFRPKLLPSIGPSNVIADFILGLLLILAHCAVVPLVIDAWRFSLSPQLIIFDENTEIGRYFWRDGEWVRSMTEVKNRQEKV